MGRRSLYYWSRLYNNGLKSGEEYIELKRTVAINILEFNLFDKKTYPNYHSCFGLYDIKTGNHLTSDCEIHFLELPKWHLKSVKETNRLERWLSYFSKRTTVKELEEIAMIEPAIEKAFHAESLFTQDEINRRRYELREKNQRDRIAQMKYAIKQALTEEREKWERQSAQEEENRVIRLIKKGKSLDDILDFSSLPQERVQQLFDEHQS